MNVLEAKPLGSLLSSLRTSQREKELSVNSLNVKTAAKQKYAPVNGLEMYYEIEGTGDPLVCIPPAFGYAGVNPYPALVGTHTGSMVARQIFQNVRFRSSNMPKMWPDC